MMRGSLVHHENEEKMIWTVDPFNKTVLFSDGTSAYYEDLEPREFFGRTKLYINNNSSYFTAKCIDYPYNCRTWYHTYA